MIQGTSYEQSNTPPPKKKTTPLVYTSLPPTLVSVEKGIFPIVPAVVRQCGIVSKPELFLVIPKIGNHGTSNNSPQKILLMSIASEDTQEHNFFSVIRGGDVYTLGSWHSACQHFHMLMEICGVNLQERSNPTQRNRGETSQHCLLFHYWLLLLVEAGKLHWVITNNFPKYFSVSDLIDLWG